MEQPLKNIDNQSAVSAFGDAARFLRAVKYKGLLIMLDEAETMPSAGRSGMEQSFLNLVMLMAFCRQRQDIYCVYATTPYFDHVFSAQLRALGVDEGLKEWLREQYQASQIGLSIPDSRTLLQLASRIYGIYEMAYERHQLPGRSWLATQSEEMVSRMTTGDSTRDFVTGVVGRLDRTLQ